MDDSYEEYEFVESNNDDDSSNSESGCTGIGETNSQNIRNSNISGIVGVADEASDYSRAVEVKRRIYGLEYRIPLPFEAQPECATSLRVEASCPSEACLLPQQQQQPYKNQESPTQAACYKRPKIGSAKENEDNINDEKSSSYVTSERSLSSDGDVTLDYLCPTSRWYVQLPIREADIPPVCEKCYAINCVCDEEQM